MSLNWSLKELYPSFESQEFKIDMDRLTSKINEVNEWANEIVKDNNDILIKLEDYIKKYSKLTELISKIGSFIQLSISVNTKDAEALRYSDIFEKKLTHIVEASTKVERYISNIENIDCIIEKSELLKAHEYVLKSIVALRLSFFPANLSIKISLTFPTTTPSKINAITKVTGNAFKFIKNTSLFITPLCIAMFSIPIKNAIIKHMHTPNINPSFLLLGIKKPPKK